MKMMASVLFLVVALGVVKAQNPRCVPETAPRRDNAARLQLTTSIAESSYSVEPGSKSLTLSLSLSYLNTGTRSILLDKKSSLVYRTLVSKNLRAVAACKYLHDVSAHFIGAQSMHAGEPERSEFVILKPGESIIFKRAVRLRLYDGTKDTKDDLHPGNYILQIRVAAWFYYADPAEYEKKWAAEAYVWSENVTSEPMAFTVEKR